MGCNTKQTSRIDEPIRRFYIADETASLIKPSQMLFSELYDSQIIIAECGKNRLITLKKRIIHCHAG